MKSTIIAKGIEASEDLREYVMQRLNSTLKSVQSSIESVTVYLSDINGTKGGIDKRCLINVKIPGRPHIVITELAFDINRAIDSATQRASIAVGRMVSRAKATSHETMPMYMKNLASYLAI